MTTHLRLLAFHFWEKLINQNLWVYPISWDTAKRSFYARITTKTEVAKFLFCEALLVLIGVGCSGFLLTKQIVLPSLDVSILHLVIWIISVCGASLAGIGSFVFYSNREYIALILREILHLETLSKTKEPSATQPTKLDCLGLFLNIFVMFGLFVPAILPFLIYWEIDPLFFIFQMLLANDEYYQNVSKGFLLLTRMCIETYLVFGAIRLAWLVVISSSVYLKVLLFCIAQLNQNSSLVRLLTLTNKNVLMQSFKKYRGFYIIIEEVNNIFANTGTLISLSGMLVFAICCLFVIIRMSYILKIVPIVYIGAIGLVVLLIMMVHFEIPDLVTLHKLSCETLRSWRLHSTLLQERKHADRILRSLRPCSFGAGFGRTKLFVLKRCTLATFYSVMANYVATALITDIEVKYLQ